MAIGRWFFTSSIEFIKPFFAVVAAWMFSEWRSRTSFPGHFISLLIFIIIVSLVLGQPDLGQTVVISAVWSANFSWQVFLSFLLYLSLYLGLLGW